MTYEELPVGQEIKINEREFDPVTGKTRTVKRQYIVSAKYPGMCVAADGKGRKRGLSLGDLLVNGIIEQGCKFEALRKEASSSTWKK